MYIFDLHCDTISNALRNNLELFRNNLSYDFERANKCEKSMQVMAIFMGDDMRGENAIKYYEEQYNYFMEQTSKPESKAVIDSGRVTPILSVEGGHCIGGELWRIEQLKERGFKIFSLTWNGENELAGGSSTEAGLTSKGEEAIKLLEENDILLDVSHLSFKAFDDVMKVVTKPVIATHSNSFEIFNCGRNLKDYQLKLIAQSGGVVGINLFTLFINGESDCSLDDITRHIDHMLNFGVKVSLGTDFDGATMPSQLPDISSLSILNEHLVKNYGERLAHEIMYENAKKLIIDGCYR